ncbi:MAG: hypothetical protein KAH01_01015 [Caldisericia bacterium]|nr:hypothetical protein [Caldisericia bacterium]
MKKNITFLLVILYVLTLLFNNVNSVRAEAKTLPVNTYNELFSYLPMNCWVKNDKYDLTEVDENEMISFVEKSQYLDGRYLQSVKIYPVSLPILLVRHNLQWKAHYYPQIRLVCNFGKESKTIHITGIRFQKTGSWIFGDIHISPCMREIGFSGGFYSRVKIPKVYPNSYVYFSYFLKHIQNLDEDVSQEMLEAIHLLFSAQMWNPFFNSELPFLIQGSTPIDFDKLVLLSNSEELYNYLSLNYSFEKVEEELYKGNEPIFIEQARNIMTNSGYDNPKHFDWDNAKVEYATVIEIEDRNGENGFYYSNIHVKVSKFTNQDISNVYNFSALHKEDTWTFQNSDHISSSEGWYYQMPNVYSFQGMSYEDKTYQYYSSTVCYLLLNRFPVKNTDIITLMWSLKRWNFDKMN